MQQLGEMKTKYKDLLANVPANLTSQFKDRMTRSVAVEMSRKRAELGQNAMFPSIDNQTKVQQKLEEMQKLEGIKNEKHLFAKNVRSPVWDMQKTAVLHNKIFLDRLIQCLHFWTGKPVQHPLIFK